MLRFPHFLEKQLIDGSKVVSPKRWPPFSPQEYSKNIPRIFLVLISVEG
jgi:hypothetical protein